MRPEVLPGCMCKGREDAPGQKTSAGSLPGFSASPHHQPLSNFLLSCSHGCVSLSHLLSKPCLPTSLKSVSSVLKTNKTNSTHTQSTHTGQNTEQWNPETQSCLSNLLVLWPLRDYYNSLSTSFLICKTDVTIHPDSKIVKTKQNNICESSLYTRKHSYCYITGTQSNWGVYLWPVEVCYWESPQPWSGLFCDPRLPVSNLSPPISSS